MEGLEGLEGLMAGPWQLLIRSVVVVVYSGSGSGHSPSSRLPLTLAESSVQQQHWEVTTNTPHSSLHPPPNTQQPCTAQPSEQAFFGGNILILMIFEVNNSDELILNILSSPKIFFFINCMLRERKRERERERERESTQHNAGWSSRRAGADHTAHSTQHRTKSGLPVLGGGGRRWEVVGGGGRWWEVPLYSLIISLHFRLLSNWATTWWTRNGSPGLLDHSADQIDFCSNAGWGIIYLKNQIQHLSVIQLEIIRDRISFCYI